MKRNHSMRSYCAYFIMSFYAQHCTNNSTKSNSVFVSQHKERYPVLQFTSSEEFILLHTPNITLSKETFNLVLSNTQSTC